MIMVSIQDQLFQLIRDKLPPGRSLADVVAEVLFLSNDSAYRRIRGETSLVLEETKILCSHFGISLDRLLDLHKGSVLFTPIELDNQNYSFTDFLSGILRNLRSLAASEKSELIYLAKDLPLFHYFNFRPLFAFRYFFWMKSILRHPDFVNARFSWNCMPDRVFHLGQEILEVYNSIPSTEICNTECVNSTIAQIEYYREAGYFAEEDDIAALYEALRSTLDHLRLQVEKGAKFLPGRTTGHNGGLFHFFYNRVILGDNTILGLQGKRKVLYLNYDVLNYMVTEDQGFCENVYLKLQMLMRSATILSSVSEKQRNIFFNLLSRKIPSQ